MLFQRILPRSPFSAAVFAVLSQTPEAPLSNAAHENFKVDKLMRATRKVTFPKIVYVFRQTSLHVTFLHCQVLHAIPLKNKLKHSNRSTPGSRRRRPFFGPPPSPVFWYAAVKKGHGAQLWCQWSVSEFRVDSQSVQFRVCRRVVSG